MMMVEVVSLWSDLSDDEKTAVANLVCGSPLAMTPELFDMEVA